MDSIRRFEQAAEAGEAHAEMIGNILVDAFQLLALFVIGATIVWSAVHNICPPWPKEIRDAIAGHRPKETQSRRP